MPLPRRNLTRGRSGAFAVHELALGPEVSQGVQYMPEYCLIDVAVVVHLLEDALDAGDVVIGSVVRMKRSLEMFTSFQRSRMPPKVPDDVVHELLRRHAGVLGLFPRSSGRVRPYR